MQTMSTLSAANLHRGGKKDSSEAKETLVTDPYIAAISSNLSTSLNPTPKQPLAYHWRNQNAQKN